jgi:hypothetical protein
LWRAITESDAEPALLSYKITDKDTRGPFFKKIPEDFRAQAPSGARFGGRSFTCAATIRF